jgi:hypothetical protein
MSNVPWYVGYAILVPTLLVATYVLASLPVAPKFKPK